MIGISTTAILPFQAGEAQAAMEVSRDLRIAYDMQLRKPVAVVLESLSPAWTCLCASASA
ncbi:MAG: hypothetical protein A2Y76_04075 [Planctomycetes bacterium RBG_13_60_9]|nr:MAG: hypothetical protein A2Y76_04075 [Planctomycetes bacterium RBG_13_60_9]